MDALARLEAEHEVHLDEPGEDFQRRARLLQAMWREERGYPIGRYTPRGHGERTMGSLLDADWAKETLLNFLTETVREVVRAEVIDPVRSRGKLYGKPRIFYNLLSSQPLCFNLFGELQRDLHLATAAMRDLTGPLDSIHLREVTAVDFEYSPGRGDPAYLDDGTAFDVFVEFATLGGGRGFLGIEVKYHESLGGGGDDYKELYAQRAREMGCFDPDRLDELRKPRLQQVWRDHLLAGVMRKVDGYDEGCFVFLRPRDNSACADAVADYRACLTLEDTFAEWILEDVVDALRRHTDAAWVELFFDRYLDFGKVEAELARVTSMEASGD